MSAVDRVMRAYASKHVLNPRQAAFVRDELSKFIDELTARQRPASMTLPETSDEASVSATPGILARTGEEDR